MPSIAAGAGPSSAIARTIAMNDAEIRAFDATRIARKSLRRAIASSRIQRLMGCQSEARQLSVMPTTDTPRSATSASGMSLRTPDTPAKIGIWRAFLEPGRVGLRAVRAPSAALRAPGFRRLAFSYTVNDLGDTFGLVALAVLVFDQTGSALGTTALFVAGRFVPAFLAPLLTARLDRAPPQSVLGALYAIEALVFAGLALLGTDFKLRAGLSAALIEGTLAITARGVSRGAIANTLEGEGALRAGNAIINGLFSASSVIGPVLGGVVTAPAGPPTRLAVEGANFALVPLVHPAAPLPHPSHEDAPG